ncbi:class II aldolase/adducin family protein [Hydrogenivirga sp.]
MEWIYREIREVGRLLFREGLVSARSGNISRAFGGRIFITRTGSNVGALRKEDIISLPLQGSHLLDERASVELLVHRRIIRETGKGSVVHAHPTYTLLISFTGELIEPADSEGKEILGSVPVLELEKPSASEELAKRASEVLKRRPAVVIRGHGVFAADRELHRAYSLLSTLEHSCKILFLKDRR